MTPFGDTLGACLLVAGIVVIKICLKSLGGYGEEGVNRLAVNQPVSLFADGIKEQLIAVEQRLIPRRLHRLPRLPGLLRVT